MLWKNSMTLHCCIVMLRNPNPLTFPFLTVRGMFAFILTLHNLYLDHLKTLNLTSKGQYKLDI